jgi:hypothetical protein
MVRPTSKSYWGRTLATPGAKRSNMKDGPALPDCSPATVAPRVFQLSLPAHSLTALWPGFS